MSSSDLPKLWTEPTKIGHILTVPRYYLNVLIVNRYSTIWVKNVMEFLGPSKDDIAYRISNKASLAWYPQSINTRTFMHCDLWGLWLPAVWHRQVERWPEVSQPCFACLGNINHVTVDHVVAERLGPEFDLPIISTKKLDNMAHWALLIHRIIVFHGFKFYPLCNNRAALGIWNCGCQLFHRRELCEWQYYYEPQNLLVPDVMFWNSMGARHQRTS